MIAPPSARDLVLSLRDLPSSPTVYLRLSDLCAGSDWDIRDAADLIGADPALAARVLRLANSPFYGVPRTVGSMHEAATLLGGGEIRALVLATTVLERFNDLPSEVGAVELMRRRAVHCALVSARLGALSGPLAQGCEWFLIGLFFDVGSLVACIQLPEAVREAANMGRIPDETGGPSIECVVTGSEQALVGAELLSQWQLPEVVAEAVRWSRVPLEAPAYRREAAVLHLATRVSAPLARGVEVKPSELPVDEAVWSLCGLRAADADSVPARVAQDYAEVASSLTANG